MPTDLKLLAQFDTPTICNTIELFEIRPRTAGYMDGRIRACFPEMPAVVGYAATATMRCALPRREGDVYSSLDEQVARFSELPGPPIVVFQDLDDPAAAATFGEIMCTTYQSFGAVALITSGAPSVARFSEARKAMMSAQSALSKRVRRQT
jgi:4-hydroxy-4-methyl-2-oxoglutarate aldolase